ncbi:MAG: GHKL domain-containing protein [Lachnospiraceae bacterium]|nr:GHKL domain-containing protein [Lachnospiraceae bacterium]
MQKKQLDFQAANYDKISHSYREGRRIIHEVKRFNSYILTCAEKNECSKIIDYINSNNNEMEKRLLCVNTGNLSDNSFNAARAYMGKHPSGSDDAWIDMKLITKQRFFVIRIENICSDDNPSHSESVSQLTHGYGLINVRNIVEKYNGLYYQETADGKYSTTVSIPILRDSVGAIIRQPASFERYEPNIN